MILSVHWVSLAVSIFLETCLLQMTTYTCLLYFIVVFLSLDISDMTPNNIKGTNNNVQKKIITIIAEKERSKEDPDNVLSKVM
jgi:hypothetical protein